jgi:hypothetical protein
MNHKQHGQRMKDRLTQLSSFYVEAEQQLIDDPVHQKYWSLKLAEAGEEIDKIAAEMMEAD